MEDNIETLSAAGKNPNVRGQLKDDAENGKKSPFNSQNFY